MAAARPIEWPGVRWTVPGDGAAGLPLRLPASPPPDGHIRDGATDRDRALGGRRVPHHHHRGGGGYYAVGLALRWPGARVLAFETLPEQRQNLALTAKANGVDDRVVARGTCTAHTLGERLAAAEPPVLVLADIEGNQRALFDAEVTARLVRATEGAAQRGPVG